MILCSERVRTILAAAIGAASALLAVAAIAQPYPSKPVRIIVPFAPGGASDLLPRMVGQKLTEAWGQQIIVDNRPGGAGNIGMGLGAKAPPDGYTLLSAPNGNLVVNPHIPKLPQRVPRSAPITLMAAVRTSSSFIPASR